MLRGASPPGSVTTSWSDLTPAIRRHSSERSRRTARRQRRHDLTPQQYANESSTSDTKTGPSGKWCCDFRRLVEPVGANGSCRVDPYGCDPQNHRMPITPLPYTSGPSVAPRTGDAGSARQDGVPGPIGRTALLLVVSDHGDEPMPSIIDGVSSSEDQTKGRTGRFPTRSRRRPAVRRTPTRRDLTAKCTTRRCTFRTSPSDEASRCVPVRCDPLGVRSQQNSP
jgi:hypothetical protein